jgi:hypothetical protein
VEESAAKIINCNSRLSDAATDLKNMVLVLALNETTAVKQTDGNGVKECMAV